MKNLVLIQNELKVPKENYNAFSKFHYRSAEDILEALKPLLLKYEAIFTISDALICLNGKVFLQATATIMIEGVSFSVNGFAETSEHKGMSAEQTTGTASSYARKYALNGLFLIDETVSDADTQPPPPQAQQAQPAQNPNLVTLERIRNAEKSIRELEGDVDSFDPTGKTQADFARRLESLKVQYKKLKLSVIADNPA